MTYRSYFGSQNSTLFFGGEVKMIVGKIPLSHFQGVHLRLLGLGMGLISQESISLFDDCS